MSAERTELEQMAVDRLLQRYGNPLRFRLDPAGKMVTVGTDAQNYATARWDTADNPTWVSATFDAMLTFLALRNQSG